MKSTLTTASSLSQLPLAKELSPTVSTSLDLSINSFRHLENHPAASPSPDRRARRGINWALNPEEGIKEDNYGLDTRRERPAAKEEGIVSVEEFDRIVSENKKLTELLSTMYTDIRTHNVIEPKSTGQGSMTTRKRKYLEDYEWTNVIGACKSSTNGDDDMYRMAQETGRSKVFRVYARVNPSDMSLIVRDGYHWRKYGQKVTRDNPSPRAYFKCSFAPSCPVKKKVQRSVDDPSLLVATYEGWHNHQSPTQRVTVSPNSSSAQGYPKPAPVIPSSPTVTTGGPSTPSAVLDLAQPPGQPTPVAKQPVQETNHGASVSTTDGFPRLFVQQMASSLTRDPSFTAALATAISGWILDQELPENRKMQFPDHIDEVSRYMLMVVKWDFETRLQYQLDMIQLTNQHGAELNCVWHVQMNPDPVSCLCGCASLKRYAFREHGYVGKPSRSAREKSLFKFLQAMGCTCNFDRSMGSCRHNF